MKKKFLLVSEGPTDYLVIKEIASSLKTVRGEDIEVSLLAPQTDATSGSYPSHGWGGIRAWCMKFSNKTEAELAALPPQAQQFLRRQNWRALLAINNAAGLIIQLDTDIAHDISHVDAYVPGSCRTTHCNDTILFWLKEAATSSHLYLALTSYALETWLLATHPPADPVFSDLAAGFNYESLADFEDRLVALGYPAVKKSGRRRFKKSPFTRYEVYGKKIVASLADVRSRCDAAEQLCSHMER
ncbi:MULTISPECIES: hypothetical protein [Pseudomonas]|uniref:hypothetical protein n=1 Tax=Pseudomonas TaxID=286 RepID=UPI001179E249|nr:MULTISPECIES: hypothetical protein [Pseudomonas]